jgi:hypothetical protein
MAIAWSASLEFTVERTTKTLVGSAASGEGLVNVYQRHRDGCWCRRCLECVNTNQRISNHRKIDKPGKNNIEFIVSGEDFTKRRC